MFFQPSKAGVQLVLVGWLAGLSAWSTTKKKKKWPKPPKTSLLNQLGGPGKPANQLGLVLAVLCIYSKLGYIEVRVLHFYFTVMKLGKIYNKQARSGWHLNFVKNRHSDSAKTVELSVQFCVGLLITKSHHGTHRWHYGYHTCSICQEWYEIQSWLLYSS